MAKEFLWDDYGLKPEMVCGTGCTTVNATQVNEEVLLKGEL